MEQLKGRQTMSVCADSICLSSFLPADFKEQAARTQGFQNRARAPSPKPPPARFLVRQLQIDPHEP